MEPLKEINYDEFIGKIIANFIQKRETIENMLKQCDSTFVASGNEVCIKHIPSGEVTRLFVTEHVAEEIKYFEYLCLEPEEDEDGEI